MSQTSRPFSSVLRDSSIVCSSIVPSPAIAEAISMVPSGAAEEFAYSEKLLEKASILRSRFWEATS